MRTCDRICADMPVDGCCRDPQDGRELTRRIRNGRTECNDADREDRAVLAEGFCPPVVGLSGCCAPEDRASSMAAGMVGVLSKPVSLQNLVAAVRLPPAHPSGPVSCVILLAIWGSLLGGTS